jgi:hypothetical protein
MHYPKNSFIIAMMALFLGLIIDILISNAISLEDNQKLLLVSAEQLTISNLISNATQNNSHNIKKALSIKNNQKFTNSIKKNDEKLQNVIDEKSDINSGFSSGQVSSNQSNGKKIYLIHQELPKIPEELRHNNFHVHALARLQINNNGIVYGVKLIEPTNNVLINKLLVASLYKWRFGGLDSDIIKDIRVDFAVE